MGETPFTTTTAGRDASPTTSTTTPPSTPPPTGPITTAQPVKKTVWQRIAAPGSVWQIIIAALAAIVIGLIVSTQVDIVPESAARLTGIPGVLWLRALRAVGMLKYFLLYTRVDIHMDTLHACPYKHGAYKHQQLELMLTMTTVLPMIITAMIQAIQRLRSMTSSSGAAGKLARWTIGYYVVTTVIAVAHSCLLVGLVWSKLMRPVSGEQLQVAEKDKETISEREDVQIHEVIAEMFNSLVPNNVVNALATDSLLAVLVTSVVVGYIIKPGGALMRAVEEVEVMIMRIITVLIYFAPVGVFFLILANLVRLDIKEIGMNLGILIGATLVGMVLHLFVLIPIIFFVVTRKNPYTMWMKCSPAWITAWGTASSAATLPVTIRCVLERGVPVTVTKFAVPLGKLAARF